MHPFSKVVFKHIFKTINVVTLLEKNFEIKYFKCRLNGISAKNFIHDVRLKLYSFELVI